jgi:hypothetical protein
MEENRRLVLDTTVSDTDAITGDINNPQAINASIPAAVENTATPDVSTPIGGIALDIIESASVDDGVLIITSSICFVYDQVVSASFDTRLACSRWAADEITGDSDRAMEMTSNLRTVDSYETIVDQFGRQHPRTHYLLKEGGNGYLTYENGDRILIL